MPIDLIVIFKSASAIHGTAKLLGLVHDLTAAKLDLLIGSELDAGLQTLRQVETSEREHESLLREARSRFIKATSLESSGIRAAHSWLGLAFCHWHLGDKRNAESCLSAIPYINQPPLPPHKYPLMMILGFGFLPMSLREALREIRSDPDASGLSLWELLRLANDRMGDYSDANYNAACKLYKLAGVWDYELEKLQEAVRLQQSSIFESV